MTGLHFTRLDPLARTRPERRASVDRVIDAMNRAEEAISRSAGPALDRLADWFFDLRRSLSPQDWAAAIRESIWPHPLLSVLHEEPLTARAFRKPRGYAGDAVMLDFMYGEGPPVDCASAFGRELHMSIVRRPASRSVRYRCDLLASLIDESAHTVDRPRILAIACGHLREAARSYAVRCGAVSELVAVDQDPESLANVARVYEGRPVRPVKSSVRRILTGAIEGSFDFVYSAGLYDYLPDAVAAALTRTLLAKLRPGGRLVVANFTPDLPDAGYMEAAMDWRLIYRDERQLRQFASEAPGVAVETFRDPDGNVVYLDLSRRPR